jgi:hypothetical protein
MSEFLVADVDPGRNPDTVIGVGKLSFVVDGDGVVGAGFETSCIDVELSICTVSALTTPTITTVSVFAAGGADGQIFSRFLSIAM